MDLYYWVLDQKQDIAQPNLYSIGRYLVSDPTPIDTNPRGLLKMNYCYYYSNTIMHQQTRACAETICNLFIYLFIALQIICTIDYYYVTMTVFCVCLEI